LALNWQKREGLSPFALNPTHATNPMLQLGTCTLIEDPLLWWLNQPGISFPGTAIPNPGLGLDKPYTMKNQNVRWREGGRERYKEVGVWLREDLEVSFKHGKTTYATRNAFKVLAVLHAQ